MNKKIIGMFICILLIATALPVIGTENIGYKNLENNIILKSVTSIGYHNFDEVIDQDYSNVSSNFGFKFTKTLLLAQGFMPSLKTLTKVEIPFFAYGTPPANSKITMSIKSDLDSADILASLTIDANQIKSSPTWIVFDIQDISVVPETQYYIICKSTTEDIENNVYGWVSSLSDVKYSRGNPYYCLAGIWYKYGQTWDLCFRTYGILEDNTPPQTPSRPTGTDNGNIGVNYNYSTSTIDPENHMVYYLWDWGDGRTSEWIGPYKSGEICEITNMWHLKGNYEIKVKAKDRWGLESAWSDPLPITMPYSYNPIHQFLKLLFERFPNAFPLLRHLVE